MTGHDGPHPLVESLPTYNLVRSRTLTVRVPLRVLPWSTDKHTHKGVTHLSSLRRNSSRTSHLPEFENVGETDSTSQFFLRLRHRYKLTFDTALIINSQGTYVYLS